MKLVKFIGALLLTFGLLNADPIDLSGKKDGYEITLKSEKSLVVGNNTFFITLAKDTVAVTNAKVKIKFFMPEMPGMPYMEQTQKAKFVDGKFKTSINFPMGGTWQYHLKFKTQDGKVHTIRSSINL
ncbi:MAG: FixH family protein [Halarcobacter sp.]